MEVEDGASIATISGAEGANVVCDGQKEWEEL